MRHSNCGGAYGSNERQYPGHKGCSRTHPLRRGAGTIPVWCSIRPESEGRLHTGQGMAGAGHKADKET